MRTQDEMIAALAPDADWNDDAREEREFERYGRKVRQWFVQDPATGRIRFTQAGRAHFRERFARSGFQIDQIRTMAQFGAAVDATFEREMGEMATRIRGEDPVLDQILSGLPGWAIASSPA